MRIFKDRRPPDARGFGRLPKRDHCEYLQAEVIRNRKGRSEGAKAEDFLMVTFGFVVQALWKAASERGNN